MKIGIDARMYGPRHSGIGRYVEQLIQHLGEMASSHEFVVFLKQEAYDSFVPPTPQWKKVLADVHWYGVAEQRKMPRIINKAQIDLMHFPHWNVPFFYRGPYVVTIHDLIMFHHARAAASTHGPLVYWIKDRLHRWLLRRVAQRAHFIYVTSQYTKQDIVSTLGVAAAKIKVTYQAPLPRLHHDMPQTRLREIWGIQKPYVLYVGNAYPHKNVQRLIDAWSLFSAEHPAYQLVLAGKASPWYEALQEQTAGIESIVYTGYVTDEELATLYHHAHLYVFPSLYEGFGLPPLEAMQYGVPVISSSASCLPEVLGNAALYFDPTSIEDIARALAAGTSNGEIRSIVRENAKEELARYSFAQLARETYEVYEQVGRA